MTGGTQKSLTRIMRYRPGRVFSAGDICAWLTQPYYERMEAVDMAIEGGLIVQNVDDNGQKIQSWTRI